MIDINHTVDVINNFIVTIFELCVVYGDESWWVDTRATRHMGKDRHLFMSYKELKENIPTLYMGSNFEAKVQGIGHVELLLILDKKLTLMKVLFVLYVRKF